MNRIERYIYHGFELSMAKNHHERVVQRNRALRSFAKSTIHLSLLIPLFDSEAPRPSSEFPRAEKSIISAGTTN